MISRREEYRQEISFVAKNDHDPTSIHAPGVTMGLPGNVLKPQTQKWDRQVGISRQLASIVWNGLALGK
jgi:hypothetical protein